MPTTPRPVTTPKLEAVVNSVLELYDISPYVTVSLVNVSENVTYRVDDHHHRRSLAVRVHRPYYHSKGEIESELFWIDALRSAGVVEPPVPIAARNGERVVTSRDEEGRTRHVVLFEWLSGSSLDTDGNDLAWSFRRLGRLAARMHIHGSSWTPPKSFNRHTVDYDAALGTKAVWGRWQDGLAVGRPERDLLSRVDSDIQERLAAYGTDCSRFGLAHNDLRLANLLVSDDHTYVIDFDDCGFAWYMYEFASSVSFIECHPRVADWKHAWLDGYTEERPLSQIDIGMLPTFVMLRRLLLVGWVGLHHKYSREAAQLGDDFTLRTCELAEAYLAGQYLS